MMAIAVDLHMFGYSNRAAHVPIPTTAQLEVELGDRDALTVPVFFFIPEKPENFSTHNRAS